MKTQKFGIEIELTGITRKKAADVIAEYFGTEKFYIGTYYQTYGAKDRKGRTWKATFDSSIIAQRKKGGRREHASEEYKCEIVSPILEYEDLEDLQEIVRQLRHKGAFASDQCGIHIHVDASRYTPQTLRNLVNIIASKEDIREMEDQNPIPEEDGGNLYLVNGSMTKLADAGAFAGKAGGNMPQV